MQGSSLITLQNWDDWNLGGPHQVHKRFLGLGHAELSQSPQDDPWNGGRLIGELVEMAGLTYG